MAYLPDYENFSVLLDDISVHVVLWCRKGLPELFRQLTSFDFQQAFRHDVTVPRICPGSDQIFAKYQGLDPGHDLLVTPR